MGLEGVELILAVEAAFNIEITVQEAELMFTPQDIINFIANKLTLNDMGNNGCLSQTAFYQLRCLLINEFNIPRKEINLNTHLAYLIKPSKQQQLWQRIAEITTIKSLPPLVRPLWLVYSAWFISFLSLITLSFKYDLIIGFFIGISLFTMIMFLTQKQRILLPKAYTKIADLIRYLVSTHPHAFKKTPEWNLNQISQVIKDIVITELGISIEQYSAHLSFVNDYGVH